MKSGWKLLLGELIVMALMIVTVPSLATAQTRDEKVRSDRETLKDDPSWFYDDLARGLEAAAESNKPLMVVLRCIP